jgi:hypothetical protein
MLATWFVHDGGSTQDWRIKGHARKDFWRWVASWGALVKKPSVLGYDDEAYNLPLLDTREIVVPSDLQQARNAGLLFVQEVSTLIEQRAARRSSLDARVVAAAALVEVEPAEQWLLWCDLNDEGDALEKAIPGAVQIKGADKPDVKEARILEFAEGTTRVLVTKPSIAGAGVNLQRCARMIFVGIGHSFEAYYQAVRRCWRFGQSRSVVVYVITSEAEGRVLDNLKRKAADAERMGVEMSGETAAIVRAEVTSSHREATSYVATTKIRIPEWLRSETT